MPNYVQNEIKISAPHSLKTIKELFNGDDFQFDFNSFIPMPTSLNVESGSHTDRAIIYYLSERLTKPYGEIRDHVSIATLFPNSAENTYNTLSEVTLTPEEADHLYDSGIIYCGNYEKYGHTTWYDWSIENWGTKWNASDVGVLFDESGFVFQTAWSAPHPILLAMSKKYPELTLVHTWADEDMGSNTGSVVYHNGEISQEPDVPEYATSQAYEYYVRMWGPTEYLIKDEHGNWIYNPEND